MKKWLPALLLILSFAGVGAEKPLLLGYGVKPCEDYLSVYKRWQQGDDMALGQYLFYREWLSGLATGLSLATNTDVLKGVEITAALRRAQINCEEYPDEDFFNASMRLIRELSSLN
mgnify:CR=1 FL=1|jgi:hypothetical protein